MRDSKVRPGPPCSLAYGKEHHLAHEGREVRAGLHHRERVVEEVPGAGQELGAGFLRLPRVHLNRRVRFHVHTEAPARGRSSATA